MVKKATLDVTDGASVPVPEALRRILLARADEARDVARAHADTGNFGGAVAALRDMLAEIERLSGWRANDSTPLAEAYELLVDERTVFERRPSIEAYAAFRKATVSSKLAAKVPSAARSRGDASHKLIEHVAGNCPDAWLVDVSEGVRYVVREESLIGRTNEADIRVEHSDVARRQAEVFADAGAFWIADLGSMNPTKVNGAVLGWSPHKLAPGDIVRVGDVDLRYEEGERESE